MLRRADEKVTPRKRKSDGAEATPTAGASVAQRYCQTIQVPLPPQKANARTHWGTQRRLEAAWKLKAMVWLANSHKKPDAPLKRFTVHATVITARKSDLDNCTARTKVVWDLLVKRGWLENDSPDHMTSLTVVNKVDAKRPLVEVHLDGV